MVNDPNDTQHKRPNLAIKCSKSSPMTHMIDNPQDDFSNSDNHTNHITNPTGINSPPPFYTKRPDKPNKMARFKLLSKRKQSLQPKTNNISFINSTKSNST